MKRPVKTILTIAVALTLIGSIAYAAEKRKQEKIPVHTPEPTTAEEAALQAELLGDLADAQGRQPGMDTAASKKIEQGRAQPGKEG